MKKVTNPMNESSVKYQYLAAFVVNMLTMGYGVTCGWASPSIALLTSNDSPLPSGKITMEQASWIASLICFGGLIGNIFFGFITAKFGRKIPLIFMSIPTIISWMLILFAQNIYYLYASRILSGIVGGGVFIIIPAFLSEIATDRVRGFMGSTLVLSCNIGILLGFVIGGYLDFDASPKFVITITSLFGILFTFFPETPSILVKQNKLSEAEKSIQFYQNLSESANDYKSIQLEMSKLKSTVASITEGKTNENSSFKWSDLTVAPGEKAMLIGLVLALLNQFCGCFAMLNYTANIFEVAGSSMSPNTAATVVGIIQVIGSYVPTLLVDRAGRKFLFVASTVGISLGMITLGAYMMLKTWGVDVDAYSWIPVASFSFVIFIANWAVLTLPFLVISEIMPEKLKNVGPSVCMIVLWTSAFLVVKCLPLLTDCLGLHGTMFFFAGVCLLSAIFIISSMPETKGRSHDEIMNLLQ